MDLNEELITYINAKAKELLFLLKPIIEEKQKHKTKSNSSITHIPSILIENKDIKEITLSQIDYKGIVISRSFKYKKMNIGLDKSDFYNLRKFIEKLSIRKKLRNKVSSKFITDTIFNWFKLNYTGEIDSTDDFYSYLKQNIQKSVKSRKVSIPIENLSIESPFSIGDVNYDFFRKEFFRKWLEESNNSEHVEKLKNKYQGKVIASVTIVAEKNMCREIAVDKVEKSLVLLRIFSPTILFDDAIPSFFGREGSILLPSCHYFTYNNKFPNLTSSMEVNCNPIRFISNNEIKMLKQDGLDQASLLLTKPDLSELEEKIFKSLYILSRSVLSNNFEEKMIFALSSIETLLLKDSNEPIQSNIGRRLAYINSQKPEKREEINKLIKDAYNLRSEFIHHGQQIVETEILNKTRHYIFLSFMKIIRLTNKIQTHQELITQIEHLTWQ
ncbi:MAG: hypothetical protein KAW92_12345 [Candidatus Cloacimonetes bacterium]|nr:hypothetical protein [Candidatus Cloacimonadota bacterium]